MQNITGFIVKVTPAENKPVEYQYDGRKAVLENVDEFIGYFWQMTGKQDNDDWKYAHIQKIQLIDQVKKIYQNEKEAVFETDKVNISIHAKRGPDSNNEHLPGEFDRYETWYRK